MASSATSYKSQGLCDGLQGNPSFFLRLLGLTDCLLAPEGPTDNSPGQGDASLASVPPPWFVVPLAFASPNGAIHGLSLVRYCRKYLSKTTQSCSPYFFQLAASG